MRYENITRYRKKFKLFWLRGDSAFADPDIYEYCEANRITYFIRLRENAVLTKLIKPHLQRPVGRPPKSGVQVKYVNLEYQAGSWDRARLKMGFLAYNLLHLIRRFYLWGEDARRSIEWIITRLVKAGARIVYHARRWHVHVASAFPLGHHYRAVLGWQC